MPATLRSRKHPRLVDVDPPFVIEITAEPGNGKGWWIVRVQGREWTRARTGAFNYRMDQTAREAKKTWTEQLGFEAKVHVVRPGGVEGSRRRARRREGGS